MGYENKGVVKWEHLRTELKNKFFLVSGLAAISICAVQRVRNQHLFLWSLGSKRNNTKYLQG